MEQDTRTELTEERVREIVREEVQKVLGEHARFSLETELGEEEVRHLLGEDSVGSKVQAST